MKSPTSLVLVTTLATIPLIGNFYPTWELEAVHIHTMATESEEIICLTLRATSKTYQQVMMLLLSMKSSMKANS